MLLAYRTGAGNAPGFVYMCKHDVRPLQSFRIKIALTRTPLPCSAVKHFIPLHYLLAFYLPFILSLFHLFIQSSLLLYARFISIFSCYSHPLYHFSYLILLYLFSPFSSHQSPVSSSRPGKDPYPQNPSG